MDSGIPFLQLGSSGHALLQGLQEATPTLGPSFKGLTEETRTTWY